MIIKKCGEVDKPLFCLEYRNSLVYDEIHSKLGPFSPNFLSGLIELVKLF